MVGPGPAAVGSSRVLPTGRGRTRRWSARSVIGRRGGRRPPCGTRLSQQPPANGLTAEHPRSTGRWRRRRRWAPPGHVGVGAPQPPLQRLHDGRAREVQIVARVAIGAMRKAAEFAQPAERTVHAFRSEDPKDLAESRGLPGLVADMRPIQTQGGAGSYSTISIPRPPRAAAPAYVEAPTPVTAPGLPPATRWRRPSRYRSATSALRMSSTETMSKKFQSVRSNGMEA